MAGYVDLPEILAADEAPGLDVLFAEREPNDKIAIAILSSAFSSLMPRTGKKLSVFVPSHLLSAFFDHTAQTITPFCLTSRCNNRDYITTPLRIVYFFLHDGGLSDLAQAVIWEIWHSFTFDQTGRLRPKTPIEFLPANIEL